MNGNSQGWGVQIDLDSKLPSGQKRRDAKERPWALLDTTIKSRRVVRGVVANQDDNNENNWKQRNNQ